MKIYYTGADTFDGEQKDKDKSLGGYKSSTLIPNDVLGNFFSEISMYGLDEKLRETRALIVYNEGNDSLENLNIWFDKLTNSLGKFEVAAVGLTPDSQGEVFMEKIDNIRATPFTGTFVEADTSANKQLLSASFDSKAYLGLWIRRSLSASDKAQFDCDTMYEAYQADPQEALTTEANVDITLEWD